MSNNATNTQAAQEKAALERIGDISVKIREGIRKALPTGSEQYLHVMVPGKVINYDDYWTDSSTDVVLPTKTELNQAILCDDMPTLSPIQMGPTGRSVARSYSNAISKLIPAGTTVGVDEGKPLTDDQKRYKQAMAILQSEVEDKDMSLVELYTEKQAKYTRACAEKTKAFSEALKDAQARSKTTKGARAIYDQWVQENSKTWRNYVQAAYMDWVITGRKEEVEYWFSVVDQDSAMARIEQSKEVMRWAVVQDEDGSGEYQKVKLTPSNWAKICYDKATKGTNQVKTVEWYDWEINRLEKTLSLLSVMKDNPPSLPSTGNPDEIAAKKDYDTAKAALTESMKDFKTKESAYRSLKPKAKGEAQDAYDARADPVVKAYNDANTDLIAKQKAFDEANLNLAHAVSETAQDKLLSDIAGDNGFAAAEIQSIRNKIVQYQRERDGLTSGDSQKSAAIDELAQTMGLPAPAPEPKAAPLPRALMGPKEEEEAQKAQDNMDFFTPITVEVSASSEKKHSSTEASSLSFGASASYGLFSASVSHEQSESHTKATAELANAAVKISMEVMRVDITRPWFRPELFYDDDLVCGPQVKISPGFGRLRALMDGDLNVGTKEQIEAELASYSILPLFPTSFIVACNVVLEISGSTSNLETYMNSSSSSTSVAVGYGPFFAGKGSYSKSSADQGSTCEATASGCRISIKSPQIIGWVSQMIPALPRVAKDIARPI